MALQTRMKIRTGKPIVGERFWQGVYNAVPISLFLWVVIFILLMLFDVI